VQLQPTLDPQSSTRSRLDTREGLIFSLLLVISRVAFMLVLAKLTGGRDFTDDSTLHLSMSSHPFEVLTAAMWLWVFALFYEISPEYYMMLVPL
jgi:hypothetical protein